MALLNQDLKNFEALGFRLWEIRPFTKWEIIPQISNAESISVAMFSIFVDSAGLLILVR